MIAFKLSTFQKLEMRARFLNLSIQFLSASNRYFCLLLLVSHNYICTGSCRKFSWVRGPVASWPHSKMKYLPSFLASVSPLLLAALAHKPNGSCDAFSMDDWTARTGGFTVWSILYKTQQTGAYSVILSDKDFAVIQCSDQWCCKIYACRFAREIFFSFNLLFKLGNFLNNNIKILNVLNKARVFWKYSICDLLVLVCTTGLSLWLHR